MAEYIDLDSPLELYVEHGGFYKKQISTLRDLLDTNGIPYKAADVLPRDESIKMCADAIEQLSSDLERLKDYEAFWKEEAEEALRRFRLVVADKPRWISVEERLPEDIDEEVLVCTEDYGVSGLGFVTVATYGVSGWLECWERKTYLTAVSHWMPLPQAPKGE